MKLRTIGLLVGLVVAFSLASNRAHALCALCTCGVTATGVSYPSYDPLYSGADTNGSGTISVQCSLGGIVSLLVSYEIRLSTGGSGNFTTRQMSKGASKLNYNLYRNSARNQIWGDGTGSAQALVDSYLLALGAPTTQTYTIYAQIPRQQNVVAGAYTDTIVVTVIY